MSHNIADKEPIRILLVIDNLIFSAGISMLLDSEPTFEVVAEKRRSDCLDPTYLYDPEVILLVIENSADINLIPKLLNESKHSRLLALIRSDDHHLQLEAVQNGAKGVVTDEDHPITLFAAIKALHLAQTFIPLPLTNILLRGFRNERFLYGPEPEGEGLTLRERQIIELVCQGLLNKQIAPQLRISEATVKHYLRAIFSKLQVSNRAELVAYAYRNGLVKSNGSHLEKN